MTTTDEQYVPSEDEMRHAYWLTRMLDHHADVNAAFDAFLARVRRDAALALAEHFSAEAIDQARQGNLDGADFNRAVAAEIEKQIPEETP